MTASLRSVAVFVADLERARAFYEDQLGLPVHTAGSFGFEFFDEAPHLGVHPAAHPDARAMVGRHTGITLEVPALLDLCSHLGELGVRFVAEPTQQDFGIMALVADPDGNVLALWEDNVTGAEEHG
ncbi:MAG TPA: VOC family protein [Gemmatimonadales bacterium]|jgi:catechol 2,3-dioxygenase-like lactoylglutathione lyase family enzyme